MRIAALLDAILDKKREAEAFGWTLDLLVFPIAYKEALFKAVQTEAKVGNAYSVGHQSDGFPIRLHGIKVMWSAARLPQNQVWYRYKGQGQ